MRNLFYQGNFCSECGNRLQPRFSLWPRHFCDECAARLRQRSYLTPLAGMLFIASAAVFAFSYKTRETTNHQPATAPVVSAQDSVVNRNLKVTPVQSSQKVLCGARTRKGTPCRHLVEPGQRCAQHKGKASMLANQQEPQIP